MLHEILLAALAEVEELAGVLDAVVGEALGLIVEDVLGIVAVTRPGVLGAVGVDLLIGRALGERHGAAGAARVEADEVEVRGEVGFVEGTGHAERHARAAGSAGVPRDGALGRRLLELPADHLARGHLHHRDRDIARGWVLRVDRGDEVTAQRCPPDPLGVVGVAELAAVLRAQVDLLVIVLLQSGGNVAGTCAPALRIGDAVCAVVLPEELLRQLRVVLVELLGVRARLLRRSLRRSRLGRRRLARFRRGGALSGSLGGLGRGVGDDGEVVARLQTVRGFDDVGAGSQRRTVDLGLDGAGAGLDRGLGPVDGVVAGGADDGERGRAGWISGDGDGNREVRRRGHLGVDAECDLEVGVGRRVCRRQGLLGGRG